MIGVMGVQEYERYILFIFECTTCLTFVNAEWQLAIGCINATSADTLPTNICQVHSVHV